MSQIILPTARKQPTRHNPKISVFYGAPKCGKTTAMAALPNTLIIDLEKGTELLEAMAVQATNIYEFGAILDAVYNAGIEQQRIPYEKIVIDNLTILDDWSTESAADTYRTTGMGKNFDSTNILDLPMGAGYHWHRKEVADWIKKAAMLCKELILIGHTKDKAINKGGKEVTVADLNLTGKLSNIVCGMVDATALMYRDAKGNLRINFKQDGTVAGSRNKHLVNRDIILCYAGEEVFHWDRVFRDGLSDAEIEAIEAQIVKDDETSATPVSGSIAVNI